MIDPYNPSFHPLARRCPGGGPIKRVGGKVAPFRSLQEGGASWPELATAVGVFLDNDNVLHVVAPHGLGDLFAMRVRRNPASVSPHVYHQRLAEKRWSERWPLCEVVPC